MKATPRTRATQYSSHGYAVVEAIRNAVHETAPLDYETLLTYAARIELCSSRTNTWVGTDLHTSDGDAYDASGRFWTCSHRLCPYCVAKRSRIARHQIRTATANQKLLVGENYNFITLTIVNKGLPLLKQRELIEKTWALFRKRAWFENRIIGAAKTEEFTLTKTGYHYHIHVLARTKYMNYNELRQEWTSCAREAYKDVEGGLTVLTKDRNLFAKVVRVGELKNAIQEIAKYITKTDTWHNIPTSDLLDVCRIARFPRMFELIGSFRSALRRVAGNEQIDIKKKTILDTRSLSDLSENVRWREEVRQVGAVTYLRRLTTKIEEVQSIRQAQLRIKYTAAKFWRLKGDWPKTVDDVIRRTATISTLALNREPMFPPHRWVDLNHIKEYATGTIHPAFNTDYDRT